MRDAEVGRELGRELGKESALVILDNGAKIPKNRCKIRVKFKTTLNGLTTLLKTLA